MLQTTIETNSATGGRFKRRVEIANVAGGALADYRVRELDDSGAVTREAHLTRYPRWSEYVGALPARALNALWHDSTGEDDGQDLSDVRTETCLIAVGIGKPRVLDGWRLSLHGCFGDLEVWGVSTGVSRVERVALHPWSSTRALIIQGQCLAAWRQSDLKPWPDEVRVPVHKYRDTPYVRDIDLPEPARSEFERRMRHSTRPVIPGEGLCAYAWDWTGFLAGGR